MTHAHDLSAILEQHPFFQEMSEHARKLILGCTSNQVFHDGDYLLREGQEADEFYLIRHGNVALEVHAPGRRPLVLETVGDGEVVGWSWLLPPYRVGFDARALGVVRVLAIKGACLRDKCEEDCALGYEFYKRFLPVVADRLTAARLQLLDMYGHPAAYSRLGDPLEPTSSSPARPSPEEP